MIRVARLLLASALLAAAAPGQADGSPVRIDGDFSDWAVPAFATDVAGDGGDSGIDFTRVDVSDDDRRLYLRFDTTREVQPDEGQEITLAIDADLDAGTGAIIGPIGAELLWNFGTRSGSFFTAAGSVPVTHDDLGLFMGPTVSDTQFEVAIARDAAPDGSTPLFPSDRFRFVIYHGVGTGDLLDASAVPYVFTGGAVDVPSLSFARERAGDVRIAAYNVENDGLFAGAARVAAQSRLIAAVDADVWVITEVWGHDAAAVAAKLEEHLPSAPGEAWHAVKRDAGNVVASRFPVLGSWLALPGSRITAVLLDPRPALDTDLLVVANHWSCCTADAARQDQADGLIRFLLDARTPGGSLDLVDGTPIVICGDFNLVGWRQQLVTLLTGDIDDNAASGPDSPPDWDGTALLAADLRHPDEYFAATWWDDNSPFYPGRLDWIFYTGSVLELGTHVVVETRSMTDANLAANGLLAADTRAASDHAPVFADFRAPGGDGEPEPGPPYAGGTRLAVEPNPFRDATTVRFALGAAGTYRLTVHDVAGRRVREIESGEAAAGPREAAWDGRDARGRPLAAGVYFVRLQTAAGERTRRVTVLR